MTLTKLTLITALVSVLAISVYQIDNKKCIKSHIQKTFHKEWTSYIYINKIMYPQFHSSYTSNDVICDEYEQ